MKKNREDGLSPTGVEQIVEACNKLADADRAPTVVRYSLAASCVDTSNIIQNRLRLGRDRILPEYTFLDPRAIGAWDMMSKVDVEPAVWALDYDEAGIDGSGGRPPPNEDSTPNETLGEQAIRLRQLLSLLETLYSGDTILLVFPDGTGPALLSAMIAGIPYNEVHQLEYAPGEVRFDITYESTRALFREKKISSVVGSATSYDDIIQNGRKTLAELKASASDIGQTRYVNLRDKKIEEERLEVEEVVEAKYRRQRLAKLEEENMRKKRQLQYSADNDLSSSSQFLLGVGGMLAAAGAGLAINRNESSSSEVELLVDRTKEETDTRAAMYTSNPEKTVVNGGGTSVFLSTPRPLDPKESAEKAMQEYLDRDDGGADWIRVMADIIQEPDDEEEDTIFATSSTATDKNKQQFWNESEPFQ